MLTKRFCFSLIAAMLLLLLSPPVFGQSTTFTYQGRLTDGANNSPTGSYNIQFALFGSAAGDDQIGANITELVVQVTSGVFTVNLDFGANSFSGAERFLEIRVFNPTTSAYVTLAPRQQITSAPYTVRSFNAANAVNAATLTVTTTADAVIGTPGCGDGCSLREAITAAVTGDMIVFDPTVFAGAQTINLRIGELLVNKNLTIEGTGASLLTVRRSAAAAINFRIFNISGGSTLTLNKMTVSHGSDTNSGGGILINANGRLNLNNAVVRENSTQFNGGGIHNNFGTVNITDSSILQNTAGSFGGGVSSAQAVGQTVITNTIIKDNITGGGGGGVNLTGGASFIITNSTIDSNIVNGSSNGGAGIAVNSVTGTIRYSAITRNQCQSGSCNGGGINNNSGANLTVYNSTLANNTASFGGGILNFGTLLTVNTTIAFNSINSPSPVSGGGIEGNGGRLRNTLIAGNLRLGNPSDVSGTVTSRGNNLVGNSTGSSGFSAALNDILNPAGGANLSALANNGGTTETVALLNTSPATNAGNNCVRTQSCGTDDLTVAFVNDQRFYNHVGVIDIGAFEFGGIVTAASVSVSGRVTTLDGARGLRNARVTLIDALGNTQTAMTTAFGYYRFLDIAAGQTVLVQVSSKRYVFAPQTVFVNEDIEDLNFSALAPTTKTTAK